MLECETAGRLVALSLHVYSPHAPPTAAAPDPLFLKILKSSGPLARNPPGEIKSL